MNRTEKLIAHIEAAGVEFDPFHGKPTRAHHRKTGQISATFLCCEIQKYCRTEMDNQLRGYFRGRRFNEIEIVEQWEPLPDKMLIEWDTDWSMRLLIRFNR